MRTSVCGELHDPQALALQFQRRDRSDLGALC
jgi:hypothetical protein